MFATDLHGRFETVLVVTRLIRNNDQHHVTIGLFGAPIQSAIGSVFLGCLEDSLKHAFDTGAMDRALKRWPRHFVDQRKALSAYKKKRNAAVAIRAIDKRMRRLFVSAFQSELFNAVLSRRIDEIDKIQTGDLAQKIGSGGIFRVEDGAAEQPRATDFEISPTGPLPGSRADLAGGAPGEIERAVLAEFGVDEHTFGKVGTLRVKGARRPLRFALSNPTIRNATDAISPAMEL